MKLRLAFGQARRAATRALWIAVATLVLLEMSRHNGEAFPGQFVQNRLWGVSAPWIPFSMGPETTRVLRLTKLSSSSCDDPEGRSGLGPSPLCNGEVTTRAEGWIHVFSKATGREAIYPPYILLKSRGQRCLCARR